MTLTPFIHFNGNAEEAFSFYKSVLGGNFSRLARSKDIATEEYPVSEADANKIMTIELSLNNNVLLMGSDVPEFAGKVNENENRSKISVNADSAEQASRIFMGLSKDGDVEIPLSEHNGNHFAMFRDKYGIEWMINFEGA